VRPVAALRDQLLAGRVIALAGGVPAEVEQTLRELGAEVRSDPEPPVEALVYDAMPAFGAGGAERLRQALDGAWSAIAAAANTALIPRQRTGKVILLAPPPAAGAHAEAARSALENLARTLSVEWARYGITVTMVARGEATSDDEVAQLVAYLLSVAGDYFSGCRFELGRAVPARREK